MAEYVDDTHWRAKVLLDLGFGPVIFQSVVFAPPFNLALAVRGISDPLLDPRLVALIKRTFP